MKNPSGDRKVLHIYQNTPEGSLLFYTVADFLVYFTVFCVSARKHGITVLGTCPMFDHLHDLLEADSRKEVSRTINHSGMVFNPGFGCITILVKRGFAKGRRIIGGHSWPMQFLTTRFQTK